MKIKTREFIKGLDGKPTDLSVGEALSTILMSSKTPEWATPQALFNELNTEFNFTLDPCATKENAKCAKFYTQEEDGLSKDWSGERVFCNPPYGTQMPKWVKKCAEATGGGSGDADTSSNRY